MSFRIIIDRSICNGYGACADIDPTDFAIGDDGIAIAPPTPRATRRRRARRSASARWARSRVVDEAGVEVR